MHRARSLRRAGIPRALAAILVHGFSDHIGAETAGGAAMIVAVETVAGAGDSIAEAVEIAAAIITTAMAAGIIAGITAGTHRSGVRN